MLRGVAAADSGAQCSEDGGAGRDEASMIQLRAHGGQTKCKSGMISCGTHCAYECQYCPQGNGASDCQGTCFWNQSTYTCDSKDPNHPNCRPGYLSCGDHCASQCKYCGGTASDCQGACQWNPATQTCNNPNEEPEEPECPHNQLSCGNGRCVTQCGYCGQGSRMCQGDCHWDSAENTCTAPPPPRPPTTRTTTTPRPQCSPGYLSCGGHCADSCVNCGYTV